MTPKQKEMFIAIRDYIEKYGFSPSIRDLCEMTGKSSPATVHYLLQQLKKKGYIEYIFHKNRTIHIMKDIVWMS